MAEPRTRGSEKERSARSTRTATREERKESTKEVKGGKRTSRGAAVLERIRRNRLGRFFLEAYYELRHKVTWPTFEKARNMTIAVIIISGIVGAILALADFGLYHLFLLITQR